MKYKRLVTVLATAIAVSAFGQSIDRVEFRQNGTYPFSEDIFEMNTQTKAGMPYSERMINEDVRRLFSLGMFEDVLSEVKVNFFPSLMEFRTITHKYGEQDIPANMKQKPES